MMKRITALVAASLLLASCSSTKTINDREYKPYGIANSDVHEAKDVCYEANIGDVILSFIFVETIIVPVLIIGWDLMEPVGVKHLDGSCD